MNIALVSLLRVSTRDILLYALLVVLRTIADLPLLHSSHRTKQKIIRRSGATNCTACIFFRTGSTDGD